MNRKSIGAYAALFLGVALASCQRESVPVQPELPYQSDFSKNPDNWRTGVADYGAQNGDIQFTSNWTNLPQPLDSTRKSIRISGINRSDDLFMFLKRKVSGLQPNTEYRLTFDVELASMYADNSFGIGGSPGGSVYLKAGATDHDPMVDVADGFFAVNIDKGNQSQGGPDMQVLGTIGAGNDVTSYKLISRTNQGNPFVARSNAQGELWLIVGTDSGYEGQTTLFYSQIRVSIQ